MTTKRISRSVGGVVSGIKKADFITLVGTPANQRAFSVLRSDNEENKVPNTKSVRRTRRSDSPLVSLTFPDKMTSTQAEKILSDYGLSDYKVIEEEGVLKASRADVQSIAQDKLTTIKLTSDGVTAQVLTPEGHGAVPGKSYIAMPAIEFSSETFSRSDVVEWLTENEVDFDEKALDNSSGNFVLQRMDVDANEETRSIELVEGVTATIVRADSLDVPEGFVAVISEAAYCGWGWGFLDFEAKLADVEVGEKLRESLYSVDEVLRNILYYSNLPVDVRKQLVDRTLSQFGGYVTGLLDLLPRQLLISTVGTSNAQRNDKAQEPNMSGKENVKAAPADDTSKESVTITRGELDEMIAKAIRADKEATSAPAATSEATDTPAAAQTTAALTREDVVAAFAEANKPLVERLEKLEGTTILRSDNDDSTTVQPEANLDEKSKKLKREDVFGNINLFGGR